MLQSCAAVKSAHQLWVYCTFTPCHVKMKLSHLAHLIGLIRWLQVLRFCLLRSCLNRAVRVAAKRVPCWNWDVCENPAIISTNSKSWTQQTWSSHGGPGPILHTSTCQQGVMPEALNDLKGLPRFTAGARFNYRCKNKQVMARHTI